MSIKHAHSFGRDSPISLMKYCNFLIINRCFSMYEISRRNEFSFCLAKSTTLDNVLITRYGFFICLYARRWLTCLALQIATLLPCTMQSFAIMRRDFRKKISRKIITEWLFNFPWKQSEQREVDTELRNFNNEISPVSLRNFLIIW